MSSTTTACILLCIACTRTIISSSFDDEYETVIRAISGLLAGIAVHFTAAPTLGLGADGKDRLGRRHRTDDSKITIIFTLLSLYALFDILIARHVVWGVFPYLGWTTSSVLQSSQGELGDRCHDRPSTDTQSRRNDSTLARTTERRHRSKNSGGAVHNQDDSPRLLSIGRSAPRSRTTPGPHLDRGIKPERENKTFGDSTSTASAANNVNDLYQYGSKSVKVYPPESRSTPPLRYGNRSRVGSSHVTFIDTVSTARPRPHITTIYEDSAKISGELAKKEADSGSIKNGLTLPDIAREATTPAVFFPLTRDNLQRITHAPDESDMYKTAISEERLTFHTAESTEWDSDWDSEYTLAWKTVQSGASSSTAKAPSTLSVEEILNPPSYDLDDMDDDLDVAEESSLNIDSDTDNAVVRFNAAQNQIAESIEYRPDLIPRDYVSQTYIRVEKFVSAVDGIELAEQIEVIPEPQETAYDHSDSELRRQRRHLKHLLTYEPSETSSSTTVRLSELEGNMRAIDQRAEEHRRKSLEAKRKASALGEKRRLALSNRRSDEAFRMKCAMREYVEEATREDKKAAKLVFRARNRPGTSRIDVHLLRKEEALKAVEKALREVQLKGGHQLHIIVGQGIHSVNGKPVLKPFLKSALQAQAMRVYESSNPGMLVVNMS